MGPGATRSSEPSRRFAPGLRHSLPSPALALGVEQDEATLSLRLTGEFDVAGVTRVETALERAAHSRMVVFDLRRLSFLDLAGLRTILRAHERSRSEPFDVVVVKPGGLIDRLFTPTRAGELLTLVDEPPPAGRNLDRGPGRRSE